MNTISLKKLSEQTKIDFYQLEKYIKYLNKEIIIENNVKKVNLDDLELINKFINSYSTNEISYIISHNIQPFFNGILMLTLRKKYNLNDKQFKTKIANIPLEYKYVYSDEECKMFDEFINKNSVKNKAELREMKYINEGWIPLRTILKDFGNKYNFSVNTGKSIIHLLNIDVYKPSNNLSFLNKEQKNKFEDFLKGFSSAKERRLFFQEQTILNKYGENVENPSQLKSSRIKISEKLSNYSKTENGRNKILNAQKLTNLNWNSERKNKINETKLQRYGTLNPNKAIYKYNNILFDSSWELYYYIYQKEILNNNIQRGKTFEYFINDEKHIYECDFFVNNKNVEIKGNHLIDENGNLSQMPTDEQNKCKQKCMEENNVQIISKKEMESIIKIVDEKYTKDYVSLFRIDLEFPYPTLRNKSDYDVIRYFHKSIYHAKRNEELSPFEAWQDKNLVKKSALNRLKYIGSCKPFDVVQGFNIAKIAPKVSVFNPKLAEELIKKYLNDCKTIIDSFSGFSGRMIGAWRCGKNYIGYDINKTHVEESNLIINYFDIKNCSISQKDLLNTEEKIYDENYVFFTCPPYENKEIWNENEIVKSCDEWINVCLEKYKCKKYLFVVDKTERYKNNIVETIENKSHFGSNTEYVILIEK